MPETNDALRRLAAQAGGEKAIERLRAALNSPAGKKSAQAISAQHADTLERAAQAAQRGDMAQCAQLAQQLMQTREGARLAAQLRTIFPQEGDTHGR